MRATLLFVTTFFIFQATAQTGIQIPQMFYCDNEVSSFMETHEIPGATIAIAKDGKLIYMRAFGTADQNEAESTQPYHMFRLASVSKPITAIAIMKLVEEGQLDLNATVFGEDGILDQSYYTDATITDQRIYDIKVQHLLEHSAGWDRNLACWPYSTVGCDPIGFPLGVAEALEEPNPIGSSSFVKFLLERGVDFTPGTAYAYSNIGYTTLGEIIEKITDMAYESYVKDQILAPLGICDMHLTKNLLEDKQEREGEYNYAFSTASCYGDGTLVPWQYGGLNMEAMGAHGGWMASASELIRLLVAVDGFSTKPDILEPATIDNMTTPSVNNPNYAKGWVINSGNWFHNGSLPGTSSFVGGLTNGYTWAFIFNRREEGSSNPESYWGDMNSLLIDCLSNITSTPSHDLLEAPTQNSTDLYFNVLSNTSVEVNWLSGDGERKVLVARAEVPIDEFPLDGTNYIANASFGEGEDLGAGSYIVFDGTDNQATIENLTPGTTYFFRLFDYNQNITTGDYPLYRLCNSPHESINLEVTAIEEEKLDNGFKIYPTLASDCITLALENAPDQGTLRVTDLSGRQIRQLQLDKKDATHFRLNISSLKPGVYLVSFVNSGAERVGRFFKMD